jgi:hypothetical protein
VLRGHPGPGEVWDDLFENAGADGVAPRELLLSALSSLSEPPFPEERLLRLCRSLRSVVRWAELCDAFVKLKTNEWNQYCRQLTQWERETTLDC